MKRYSFICILILIIFCSCSNKTDVADVSEQQITETSDTVSSISSETTTAVSTVATDTDSEMIETENKADEDIFEAIAFVCNERWNGYDKEPYTIYNGTDYITYDNEIDFFMNSVSRIKNNTLGKIDNEQDLISKARKVFIEVLGQDYIDRAEAEYLDRDGVKIAIAERTTPVYNIAYYEEYDIWYINACMPSGVTEDGHTFATIHDNPAFLMIRGSNGKIIGCRF